MSDAAEPMDILKGVMITTRNADSWKGFSSSAVHDTSLAIQFSGFPADDIRQARIAPKDLVYGWEAEP